MKIKRENFREIRSQLLPSSLRGNLDQFNVEEWLLVGWALDLDRPGKSVEVAVWYQDQVIAQGTANLSRPDLSKGGYASTNHGFSLVVSGDAPRGIEMPLILSIDGVAVPTRSFAMTLPTQTASLRISRAAASLTVSISAPIEKREFVSARLSVDGVPVSEFQARKGEADFVGGTIIPTEFFDNRYHLIQVDILGSGHGSITELSLLKSTVTPWEYLADVEAEIEWMPERVRHWVVDLQKRLMNFPSKSLPPELAAAVVAYEALVSPSILDPEVLYFPHTENPKVTIIIPCFNNFALTYRCLASLLLAINSIPFEVILIDDASEDKTAEIESFVQGVRVIRNLENLGYLQSCNLGATHAQGKYLMLLNNDTEVHGRWLDSLVRTLESSPKVGIVGSKLLYPDGRLQEAGVIIWSNAVPWNVGRGGNQYDPSFNYVREVDAVSGAAMLIARELWTEVGGYSSEFSPAYYEDTDLCMKVRKAGFKVMYNPSSCITHVEGASNGIELTDGVKRYQAINAPKFAEKWVGHLAYHPRFGDRPSLAKDRNVRYRALFLDDETPQLNRDAGSYAAFQEMQLLQKCGFKVTFFAANLAMMGKHTEALQQMGIECVFAPHIMGINQLLESRGKEFDLIYITRWSVAERFLDQIQSQTQAKILFNDADLHFLRELRASLLSQEDLANVLETREKELSIMRRVDAILTYSEVEKGVILSHNLRDNNVFLCPWVAPITALAHRPLSNKSGLAFLGNFLHKPNREAIEYFVQNILPNIRRAIPGLELFIYGTNSSETLQGYFGEGVNVMGFIESLDTMFDRHRLFIAPLLSGAGLKGKVIDSIVRQVPTVLSPIAAEGTHLVDGISTIIPHTDDEWVQKIKDVYYDFDYLYRIAEEAEKVCEVMYSQSHALELFGRALSYLGLPPVSENGTFDA